MVPIRVLSGFERWLSNRLHPVSIDDPDDQFAENDLRALIRGYLEVRSTWRGLGFLTLKFWFGIVGLVLAFGFATTYLMLRASVNPPRDVHFGELNGEPVIWTVDTLPEAVLAGGVGVAIAAVLVHLTNLFGYVSGHVSIALLSE